MTIHFAADHAGFELKNILMTFAQTELGLSVVDHGAHEYNESDDFPDFVIPLAQAVSSNKDKGVILGGSGNGEAMAANRVPGVRTAVYYGGNKEIITLSREHNDANVLSIGARFVEAGEAKDALRLWLQTEASTDEKYARRNQKLDSI